MPHKVSIQNRKTKKNQDAVWLVETKDMPKRVFPYAQLLDGFQTVNSQEVNEFGDRVFRAELAEVYFKEPWKPNMASFALLSNWWQRFFGKELVPWKKAERRERFGKTYEELGPYLERYNKSVK